MDTIDLENDNNNAEIFNSMAATNAHFETALGTRWGTLPFACLGLCLGAARGMRRTARLACSHKLQPQNSL